MLTVNDYIPNGFLDNLAVPKSARFCNFSALMLTIIFLIHISNPFGIMPGAPLTTEMTLAFFISQRIAVSCLKVLLSLLLLFFRKNVKLPPVYSALKSKE